jgi:PPOX class probable F420-dependent enzyme
MAQLDQKQKQFLEQPFVGVATTMRDDGTPHNTVVWVDVEDGIASFNTAVGRAKERHIRKNPRVALTVVDPQNPYNWVSITGEAELTLDGADPQIDKLAKKYLGKDEYPWRDPAQQRIKVRITPEKVEATGLE